FLSLRRKHREKPSLALPSSISGNRSCTQPGLCTHSHCKTFSQTFGPTFGPDLPTPAEHPRTTNRLHPAPVHRLRHAHARCAFLDLAKRIRSHLRRTISRPIH